jgi:hypothetical protein
MKKDATTATPSSTERARRAALAEVKARADALEAPKAARLATPPTSPDVGPASEATEGRKAASPRPPKATSAATKPAKGKGASKGKRKPVRPVPAAKGKRKPKGDRPLSGLDAAAKVLAGSGKPMRVSEIVEQMSKRGLWTSKAGRTPEATVYAAIIREIRDKGVESRFVKKDRGLFAATSEAKK